jgi:hypothetical protein
MQLHEQLRVDQFWFVEALSVLLIGASVVAGLAVLRALDGASAGVIVFAAATSERVSFFATRSKMLPFSPHVKHCWFRQYHIVQFT